VHTFLRSGGKWVPKVYVFGHTNVAVVQRWTQKIQLLLHAVSHRPKTLLVYFTLMAILCDDFQGPSCMGVRCDELCHFECNLFSQVKCSRCMTLELKAGLRNNVLKFFDFHV